MAPRQTATGIPLAALPSRGHEARGKQRIRPRQGQPRRASQIKMKIWQRKLPEPAGRLALRRFAGQPARVRYGPVRGPSGRHRSLSRTDGSFGATFGAGRMDLRDNSSRPKRENRTATRRRADGYPVGPGRCPQRARRWSPCPSTGTTVSGLPLHWLILPQLPLSWLHCMGPPLPARRRWRCGWRGGSRMNLAGAW